MASIYRTHNQRWIALIRRKNAPSISQVFDKKSDAQRWARDTESKIPSSRDTFKPHNLHEALDRYQNEQIPRYKSKKAREGEIRLLKRHLSDCLITAISFRDIALFRDNRISTGVSGSTVIKELNLLSKVFDFAIREWGWGWAFENPVKQITKPKPGKPRERRITEEEYSSLLCECDRTKHVAMKTILVLAVETGMRQGELLGLLIENIDFDICIAHLPDTKNGSPRDVPLSPTAHKALYGFIKARSSGKVFCNWSTGDGFRSSFQRLCKRLSLEDLRFHDLRHEAASRLFEKGLNQFQVAVITGHKSLQSLQRYTHLRATDLVKLL